MDEEKVEATNFVLQYCLRKDHKIVRVQTISAHSLEGLIKLLKEQFPDGDSNKV